MVDADRGVGRRIFIEPEIDQGSAGSSRAAGSLCRESQIPQPGTSSPWAKTRFCGARHARPGARLLNICRHRGNRLCRAEFGNAASFTCAYHGWTYRNDGRLAGVPYLKSLPPNWTGSAGVSSGRNYEGAAFYNVPGAVAARISRRDTCIWMFLLTAARAASRSSAVCGAVAVQLKPSENFGGDSLSWSPLRGSIRLQHGCPPCRDDRGYIIPGNGHVLIALTNDVGDPPMPEILV
jgi:3-phenylpropionate/trans-cinnamate dioxygenase alpha subunit